MAEFDINQVLNSLPGILLQARAQKQRKVEANRDFNLRTRQLNALISAQESLDKIRKEQIAVDRERIEALKPSKEIEYMIKLMRGKLMGLEIEEIDKLDSEKQVVQEAANVITEDVTLPTAVDAAITISAEDRGFFGGRELTEYDPTVYKSFVGDLATLKNAVTDLKSGASKAETLAGISSLSSVLTTYEQQLGGYAEYADQARAVVTGFGTPEAEVKSLYGIGRQGFIDNQKTIDSLLKEIGVMKLNLAIKSKAIVQSKIGINAIPK